MKQCILEEKPCTDCGACDDRCQLDPQKLCDNCFRCLDMDARPYAEIPIAGVYTEGDYLVEETLHLQRRHFVRAQTLSGLYGERRINR